MRSSTNKIPLKFNSFAVAILSVFSCSSTRKHSMPKYEMFFFEQSQKNCFYHLYQFNLYFLLFEKKMVCVNFARKFSLHAQVLTVFKLSLLFYAHAHNKELRFFTIFHYVKISSAHSPSTINPKILLLYCTKLCWILNTREYYYPKHLYGLKKKSWIALTYTMKCVLSFSLALTLSLSYYSGSFHCCCCCHYGMVSVPFTILYVDVLCSRAVFDDKKTTTMSTSGKALSIPSTENFPSFPSTHDSLLLLELVWNRGSHVSIEFDCGVYMFVSQYFFSISFFFTQCVSKCWI